MTYESVKKAKQQAEEFVRRAKEVLGEGESYHYICGTSKTGALRRQSMELTRTLAKMRKP